MLMSSILEVIVDLRFVKIIVTVMYLKMIVYALEITEQTRSAINITKKGLGSSLYTVIQW